jgi:hypothetical protein
MHFEAGTSIHATHCTENIPALRNYLNEVEGVDATRRLVEHFSIERLAQAGRLRGGTNRQRRGLVLKVSVSVDDFTSQRSPGIVHQTST